VFWTRLWPMCVPPPPRVQQALTTEQRQAGAFGRWLRQLRSTQSVSHTVLCGMCCVPHQDIIGLLVIAEEKVRNNMPISVGQD